MTDIGSMTYPELESYILSMGEKKFRAAQLYEWLHKKEAASFDEMSNLPQSLRKRLEDENGPLNFPKIRKKLVSRLDGTVKYLYAFADGETVECVRMEYKHGSSLCISSQAGCRMGCKFCASTLMGLSRNLEPYELLGQVYAAERDAGKKIDSIVMMGIGEPLDNYDNVLRFLRMLSDEKGRGLSLRHVSLSTCGLVDKIDRLAQEKLQLTLSVSLHAPNDRLRRELMPVANRWSVDELLAACWRYEAATGRRISFEYALAEGQNDSPACAEELASRLRGHLAHVNLIPVNPVEERGFSPTSQRFVERFQKLLEARHITATVRRRLGADINAACGQLRRSNREAPAGETRTAVAARRAPLG